MLFKSVNLNSKEILEKLPRKAKLIIKEASFNLESRGYKNGDYVYFDCYTTIDDDLIVSIMDYKGTPIGTGYFSWRFAVTSSRCRPVKRVTNIPVKKKGEADG